MKIQILDRQTLEECAQKPFAPHTAIISITDSDREEVELPHLPARLLRLQFDDVSYERFTELLGRKPGVREMQVLGKRFYMAENRQISSMANFILETTPEETLLCQCEYGQSRSAAVAAAVLEFYERRGILIFADPRYCPNKYVFRKLLCALRNRRCQRCS